MASSSHSHAPSDEPPPEPPTLRLKPQARGNIGTGRLYADRLAFDADVEAWEQERKVHQKLMAERKATLDNVPYRILPQQVQVFCVQNVRAPQQESK